MNDVMMNLFSNQIIFVFVFGHQNTIRSPLICQLDIIKFDHIIGLETLFWLEFLLLCWIAFMTFCVFSFLTWMGVKMWMNWLKESEAT